MTRRLLAVILLAVAVPSLAAGAQEATAGRVDVIDIRGPLDARAVDVMTDAIVAGEAQLVILQLNSAAAVTTDIGELIALVADPPVPVAAWVGPDPAVAYGGAAQLLAAASIKAAAPGAAVGLLHPTVAGRSSPAIEEVAARFPDVAPALLTGRTRVDAPVPGLVDVVVPSIGQLVVGVDGQTVTIRGEPVTLATAREVAGEDGVVRAEPAVEVRFAKGDLLTRTLRLAVRPEAAYFFLVIGLLLAAFEFYAAGAGVVAAVAVVTLLLAGYGLVALPIRPWALAATVGGVGLLLAAFQRGAIGWRGIAGTLSLAAGGWWFVDGSGQFQTVRWVVALVVLGAALFVGIGMTAVVRARYSTATIGRDHLIGRVGAAASDLTPDGEVTVDGARWRASGHREANIREGDPVEVVSVSGVVLEVEPARKTG